MNPRVAEYAVITRKFFPNTRIEFISNGLLIRKMTDEFWTVLRDNNIQMCLTSYPIDLDYKELMRYVHGKGVEGHFFNLTDVKIWRKEKFNLSLARFPKSPAVDNFMNCYKPNNCIQLFEGKMACTTIMNAKYFMEMFKEECREMHYSPRDFIDIYEVSDLQELLDFFARPFPFCRYCLPHEIENVPWERSKKEITEWI